MPNARILSCLLLPLLAGPTLAAEPIAGRASVVDGDTLDIRGTRIRLHGVDAPESAQTCRDGAGREYRCGQAAALALADRIGAATVTCEAKDRDRYGRTVAVCRAGAEDLNAWLVGQGLALAYRQYGTAYVPQEDAARAARRGVWAGPFTPPWDWRKGQREPAVPAGEARAPGPSRADCRIKGNVSAKGERIYHVPGSRHYERTVIDAGAGERMFCSEDEAEAAGWRAPRG